MLIVPILIFLGLLLILFGSICGICWYFSNRLLRRTSSATLSILVTDLDTRSVTLQSTKNTRRPGVFGITGPRGQAIVGPILSSSAKTITRTRISLVGEIAKNEHVAWNTTVFGGMLRDTLKLTIQDVFIPGPLGNLPAWFVPGKFPIWAILVHGATGTREQGLRVFQSLAEMGLNILDITYRNDADAPASTDRLSHLGDAEWEDLEASVKYALEQGAQKIILYGWSMGGTIVEVFLSRSSYAHHIIAAVLDSPILDWNATLTTLAHKNHLPAFFVKMTRYLVAIRTGITFDALNHPNQTQIHTPLLLFHGTGDSTAPITMSDTFARHHPNVTYHRIPDADHTQCWNADPEAYEAALRAFLINILDLHTHSVP